ncbi:MAG: alpha/beta hydrolase fold [Geobacteraceae bacterium]|nr:MAG: alpha/beta hydrolase fold [Geobacteraceae bacterium]
MKALINGVTMAYDEAGSGPAVVLIHGFPLNRNMWRPQAAALSEAGYQVITPDLRGFGESEVPDGPYSVDLYSDDVAGLLDHLGIERAIVGGMSMGGYVLLNLLERYPQRVSAACFITTRSNADDEAGKARRLALAKDVTASGPQVVADLFKTLLFAEETAAIKPELVSEIYGWMMDTDSRGLAGGLLAMRERKDYTQLLGHFTLPALVIGAEHDLAVPLESVRVLEAGLPDSKTCIIPHAGHMANMEQPETFNACLLKFLQGCSTRDRTAP